jgi:hypothetical protein
MATGATAPNVLCHQSVLTAGDLARALHVDLKTVHNWVRRGVLFGSRTGGRHLRFQRLDVIRALRSANRPIPRELCVQSPQVTLVGFGSQADVVPSGVAAQSLLDAALQLVVQEHDVLCVNLDAFELSSLCELVAAVRRHPHTRGRGVLGVSVSPGRSEAFLQAGGDLVVSSAGQIEDAVAAMTGTAADSNSTAEGAGARQSGEYQVVSGAERDYNRLAG